MQNNYYIYEIVDIMLKWGVCYTIAVNGYRGDEGWWTLSLPSGANSIGGDTPYNSSQFHVDDSGIIGHCDGIPTPAPTPAPTSTLAPTITRAPTLAPTTSVPTPAPTLVPTTTLEAGDFAALQAVVEQGGGRHVTISKSITFDEQLMIDGIALTLASSTGATLSGNFMTRFFEVKNDGSVVLIGLTIADGFATDAGGVIFFSNGRGTASFQDCTILRNGVANYAPPVIIAGERGWVNGLTGSAKGGVVGTASAGRQWEDVSAEVSFLDCTIQKNYAYYGSVVAQYTGTGDALANWGNDQFQLVASFQNCTISDNHGVVAYNANTSFTDCRIMDNPRDNWAAGPPGTTFFLLSRTGIPEFLMFRR